MRCRRPGTGLAIIRWASLVSCRRPATGSPLRAVLNLLQGTRQSERVAGQRGLRRASAWNSRFRLIASWMTVARQRAEDQHEQQLTGVSGRRPSPPPER